MSTPDRLDWVRMHPDLHFTRLGQMLRRHAVGDTPDLSPLSDAFLRSGGYDILKHHSRSGLPTPELDRDALELLSLWAQENAHQHSLGSAFNWDRVPRGVFMDQALGRLANEVYQGMPLSTDLDAIHETLTGGRVPRGHAQKFIDRFIQEQNLQPTAEDWDDMTRSAARLKTHHKRLRDWLYAPRRPGDTSHSIGERMHDEIPGWGTTPDDPERYADMSFPAEYCPAFMGHPTGEIPFDPRFQRRTRNIGTHRPTPYDPGAYDPSPPYTPQYQPGSGFNAQPVYPANAYPGQPGTVAAPTAVGGPATQPPFGGASYPAPDGWGHTDPLGHPYARFARYADDGGGPPDDDDDQDDTDLHQDSGDDEGYESEEHDIIQALVSVLNKALSILQPMCGANYCGPC